MLSGNSGTFQLDFMFSYMWPVCPEEMLLTLATSVAAIWKALKAFQINFRFTHHFYYSVFILVSVCNQNSTKINPCGLSIVATSIRNYFPD